MIVAGPKILDVILEELQKSITKVEESKWSDGFAMIDILNRKQWFLSLNIDSPFELEESEVNKVIHDGDLFKIEKYLSVLNGILYQK